MSNSHPFTWLTDVGQKRAFAPLAALALLMMAALQVTGGPLRTPAAPAGIISFEFAGDLPTAQAMVDSWEDSGRVFAGLNLGLDYLFLVAYGGAIGLGCVLVARGRAAPFGTLGRALAWGLIVAALLDSLENYALIRVLLGTERAWWPTVALWCAIPKFALVAAGLLYVIAGGLLALAGKKR